MEDQARDWENQEYEVKNGSWIWDKGLALGKKILVTGFVISSAPVVLPPLVVISAIGLACSVPYGIFLASYACTEKLMSKLLPISTTTPEEKYSGEHTGFGDDFDVENEEEELKRRVEMRLERDEKGNEEFKSSKEISIGEKAEEEPVIGKDSGANVEVYGVTIEIEDGEITGSNVRDVEAPLEVTSIAVELCQTGEKEENEELVKETTGLMEKLRDEGSMVDQGAGNAKQSEENVHGGAEKGLKKDDRIAGVTVIQSGDKDADADSTVGAETRKSDRKLEQNGHKTNTAIESAPAVQKEKVSDESTGDNIREENKSASGKRGRRKKSNHVKKDVDKDKEIVARTESSTDYEAPEGSKQSSYTHPKKPDSLEVTAGAIPSNEALYSEEKMWSQIDAVRKVVGYTAAQHPICIEEVKALYIFTGVQPPTSFKDASDLVEVHGKLKFLMSVIGVK